MSIPTLKFAHNNHDGRQSLTNDTYIHITHKQLRSHGRAHACCARQTLTCKPPMTNCIRTRTHACKDAQKHHKQSAHAHTQHTYVHTHTYTYAHAHTHKRMRAHTQIYTHACAHAHTHTHTHTHEHTHTHTHTHAHTYTHPTCTQPAVRCWTKPRRITKCGLMRANPTKSHQPPDLENARP